MTLFARKLTKNRVIYQQEIIKHSYGVRKQDINAFKEEPSQTDWRDVLITDDIDASSESFIGTINRIKEKYIKTAPLGCSSVKGVHITALRQENNEDDRQTSLCSTAQMY